MTDQLRDRIAAALTEDISDQLRAAGFDDKQWAADVCDNAATALMQLFTQEFMRVDERWITRWNTAWRVDE